MELVKYLKGLLFDTLSNVFQLKKYNYNLLSALYSRTVYPTPAVLADVYITQYMEHQELSNYYNFKEIVENLWT